MKRSIPGLATDHSYVYPSPQRLAMQGTKQALPWTTTPELFNGLSHSDCLKILSTGCGKDIPCFEMIFRASERTMIFLLLEGRAKVTQVTEEGVEIFLWLHVPGQIIGSLDFASHTHSSAAKALEMCKVIMWDVSTFEDNMNRFPGLFRNVMVIGARQMNDLSLRICEVSTEEAMPRLARGLIRLADQIGRRVNNQFEIDLTQEALAQMNSMNLYYLNRQLSEWERQQLVTRRRSTLVIRDLQGLKRLCGTAA